VLEGSVRKAGSRVRITGQLIDTATGAHIWADRFDSALDDIFELQDQIASSGKWTVEGRQEAVTLLRRALTIDPQYAPAAGLFAWSRSLQKIRGLITDEETTEAAGLARQAIERGRDDSDALWMGGWRLGPRSP